MVGFNNCTLLFILIGQVSILQVFLCCNLYSFWKKQPNTHDPVTSKGQVHLLLESLHIYMLVTVYSSYLICSCYSFILFGKVGTVAPCASINTPGIATAVYLISWFILGT